jgi:hypothetical protein
MPRVARFKVTGLEAWYHVYSKVVGRRGEYPLSECLPTRRLIHVQKEVHLANEGVMVLGGHLPERDQQRRISIGRSSPLRGSGQVWAESRPSPSGASRP